MNIRDLIAHAINGKADEFNATFSDIMASKTEDAIEAKFDSMFSSEEVADIEETVDPIKSSDEKRFKDKHVVDKKDHPEAEESQFTSKAKKVKRSADYNKDEEEAVYEEYDLEEAKFVPGKMKLNDGSSVTVSRDDVKALSSLFDELTGSNKKKMEDRMKEDKEGFEEILKFAKEAM